MEDALRALQQQVSALKNQNAALEAQLRVQQNIAQGLAELPGAIRTVLNRVQAPTRRMLVDQKGLRKPPVFSVREADTSSEKDGQLSMVLSALTDGESFDVVTSAGGDHGFESCGKLHRRWDPYTAGRARSLLREILSPSRAKLRELMGAIERMEDLVKTVL